MNEAPSRLAVAAALFYRRLETRVAIFTLVAAAIFAPLELIATAQMFGAGGIIHPGFFGSLVGAALVAGAVRSLRARPLRAPALMCASHAWWTGVCWHAVGLRYQISREGGELFYGSIDLWKCRARGARRFSGVRAICFLGVQRRGARRLAQSSPSSSSGSVASLRKRFRSCSS